MQNEEYCSYWSNEFSRKEYDVSARIDWTSENGTCIIVLCKT